MGKTKIEWCDYTINPVKGLCPMACSYCYARRMYKRFKWDETIRFDRHGLDASPKGGAKIFVGSTMELFGDWVKPEWLEGIFNWCKIYKKDTFIFLTKQPQNLIKWSPFPDNCWVGVSTTDAKKFIEAGTSLEIIQAAVKFISVEPLLSWDNGQPGFMANMFKQWGLNWIIIGQQTPIKAITMPKQEWIENILKASVIADVPVFLKNNLRCLYDINCNKPVQQEFPKV
jgi:protein gp37